MKKFIYCFLLVFIMVFSLAVLTVEATDIPEDDLLLWFKADALELEDGDIVNEWIDSSGNNYHAVAKDDESSPIYIGDGLNNLPVIQFDNSALITERFSEKSQPNTVIAFVKIDEKLETDQNILDGIDDGSTRNRLTYRITGEGIVIADDTWPPEIHIDFEVPSDYEVLVAIFNADQSMLMVGQEAMEGSAGSNPLSGFTIGARAGATSQYFKGKIAEIIVYNRSLNRVEIGEIYSYLEEKWLN